MSNDCPAVRIYRHLKGTRVDNGEFAMVKPGRYLAYDDSGGIAMLVPMHEDVYPDNDNALFVEIEKLPNYVKAKL